MRAPKDPAHLPALPLARPLNLGLIFPGDMITADTVVTMDGIEGFMFTGCSVF